MSTKCNGTDSAPKYNNIQPKVHSEETEKEGQTRKERGNLNYAIAYVLL